MGTATTSPSSTATIMPKTIASATTSGRLVRLPGIMMERAVAAILTMLPIDDFTDDPVRRMEVVGKPNEIPAVQQAVQAAINRTAGRRESCRCMASSVTRSIRRRVRRSQ